MKFYVKQPLFRPGGARPPTQIMVDFIHNNKDRYGVEAICRILPIAPSTYYRTLDLTDNPEHRAKRDEPYRVCRRVNILRDYPDDKTKLYPRN